MSTATKRALADAIREAETFRGFFVDCYERWEIAGSVRRRKPEVGDVEHVVMPKFDDRPAEGSMFAEPVRTNLLWQRCEKLLSARVIEKHVYAVNRADGSTGTRTMWGDSYRGCDFGGGMHEIFCATADNWGAILAIRTGPAEFSQMMVTKIRDRGLQQKDGYVRYLRDGKLYPVRTEEAFFTACGVQYQPPEVRR